MCFPADPCKKSLFSSRPVPIPVPISAPIKGRAVRLMRGLRCPNCQGELTVRDVGTSSYGEVVVSCGRCTLQILTVA